MCRVSYLWSRSRLASATAPTWCRGVAGTLRLLPRPGARHLSPTPGGAWRPPSSAAPRTLIRGSAAETAHRVLHEHHERLLRRRARPRVGVDHRHGLRDGERVAHVVELVPRHAVEAVDGDDERD